MRAAPPAISRRSFQGSANRSGVTLAGNCAYALAQFGVLVVLARQATPADVGDYALALAVTAPVQIGVGLRLRTLRAIDTGPTPFRTYLRLAIILSASAALLGTAIGVLIAPSSRFILVVGLVALAKSVEGLIDVCYGEYQRQDQLTAIAASQLIRAGLTIALVALGAHLAGLLGALVAMLIGWTAQLVILDGRRIRHTVPPGTKEPGHPRSVGDLIRLSWPLGMAAAVASLTVSLPRFTVAGLLGSAALGVLAVLSYPTTAISIFANSLGQANVRGMAAGVTSGERRGVWSSLLAMVAATSVVGTLGASLVVLAGRDGVTWLLGPAYADNFSALLLLLLAATLAGFATNAYYLLVSTGRFGLQPVVVGASLALSAPVIYVGTQHYGLIGTAATLTFMYGLQALLTAGAATFLLRRPLRAEIST
jgi:O-antigen/teichoic acid export membrane protein